MPAWSYTALTAFETCPRRFYETRVAKSIREPEGTALVLGNAAHKALELRAARGTPIPKTIQITTAQGETAIMPTTGWEAMMEKILDRPGDVLVERQIALDDRLCEVDWFDKSVWVRGVIDLGIIQGAKALLLDHKTGKRKPDTDQLKLFAALAMHVWPQLERVVTGFLWLKENKIDKDEFTRGDLSVIWDGFIPRVRRLEQAYVSGEWGPKPSGLCRDWCPVSSCEFCGRRQ